MPKDRRLRRYRNLNLNPYQHLRESDPHFFDRTYMDKLKNKLLGAPIKMKLIPGEHYAVGRFCSDKTTLFIHRKTGFVVAGLDRTIPIGHKVINYNKTEIKIMDLLRDMNAFVKIMVTTDNNTIEVLGIVKPIETEFHPLENVFVRKRLMGWIIMASSSDIRPCQHGKKYGFIVDMDAEHECVDDPEEEECNQSHSWHQLKSGDYYILGSLLWCPNLVSYVIRDNKLIMVDGQRLWYHWNDQLDNGLTVIEAMIRDDTTVKVSWDGNKITVLDCTPISFHQGKTFKYKGLRTSCQFAKPYDDVVPGVFK